MAPGQRAVRWQMLITRSPGAVLVWVHLLLFTCKCFQRD